LHWQQIVGKGQYAGIKITSPAALRLRIGLKVQSLPANAEFRFFSPQEGNDSSVRLVSGKEILEILALNKEADSSDADGEYYWSPTIKGDTICIEIYLPEGADTSAVQISFPLISHILVPLSSSIPQGMSVQGQGDSNSCQNDATCASSWANVGKTVAHMNFTSNGGTYICTGTLLNDLDPDTFKPFFLTANHCISNQVEASSLETYWFWESAFCNGSLRNPSFTGTFGGAILLDTRGMNFGTPSNNSMDITLLKLRRSPPGGVYYAGWTTAVPPGTQRTGIHHPRGDWKKISFASAAAGMNSCYWVDATHFNCVAGSGHFNLVNWTDGGTEGGSSGSALFLNNGQVIGTLTGGNGSCAGSHSFYSSFRDAYSAGNYAQWLAKSLSPVISPILPLLLSGSDDAYEQNDTLLTAYNLGGQEQIWLSTLSGPGVQWDEDWYRIFVNPQVRRVLVNLQFTHSAGNLSLELYSSNGTFQVGSYSTSDNESLNFVVPSGGAYYLVVYHGDRGSKYDLWWDDVAP
jgi:hypothetical protein